MSPEPLIDYREGKLILRKMLSHDDARTAVLRLYRLCGGNKRVNRATVIQIGTEIKEVNQRSRGDRDRKPFSKQSPFWIIID